MKNILNWLIGVEESAGEIYETAASVFKEDRELAAFLNHLREEEKIHYNVIKKALDELNCSGEAISPEVYISREKMRHIDDYLRFLKVRLATRKITKGQFLYYVATVESTECNDIFSYIVNTFKRRFSGFNDFEEASVHHKKRIESYLASQPGTAELVEKMRGLEEWRGRKLLVLSPGEGIADAVKAIFCNNVVCIDKTDSGEEAIEKIGKADGPGKTGSRPYFRLFWWIAALRLTRGIFTQGPLRPVRP